MFACTLVPAAVSAFQTASMLPKTHQERLLPLLRKTPVSAAEPAASHGAEPPRQKLLSTITETKLSTLLISHALWLIAQLSHAALPAIQRSKLPISKAELLELSLKTDTKPPAVANTLMTLMPETPLTRPSSDGPSENAPLTAQPVATTASASARCAVRSTLKLRITSVHGPVTIRKFTTSAGTSAAPQRTNTNSSSPLNLLMTAPCGLLRCTSSTLCTSSTSSNHE